MHPGPQPVVGITSTYDDGRDPDSLKPNTALNFLEAANVHAVERAGGLPVILPIARDASTVEMYAALCDGILVSGGGGFLRRRHRMRERLPDLKAISPKRFAFEAQLIRTALRQDIPILGICRGHQMIARVSGGRCYLELPAKTGGPLHSCGEIPSGRRLAHSVRILPGSRLARILGAESIWVNSLHRQAILSIPHPFIKTAWAEDGIVEALESTAHRFVVGVQFHPELLVDIDSRWNALFHAFIEAASEYGLARRSRHRGANHEVAAREVAGRGAAGREVAGHEMADREVAGHGAETDVGGV